MCVCVLSTFKQATQTAKQREHQQQLEALSQQLKAEVAALTSRVQQSEADVRKVKKKIAVRIFWREGRFASAADAAALPLFFLFFFL